MGGKDIAERELFQLNSIFADIFNVIVFNGDQIIATDDLVDVSAKSSYLDQDSKLRELERDVVKLWRRPKLTLSILAVENQTKQDPDMALRCFAYDGLSYRQQMKDRSFGRRYPVCTLVVYYAQEPWTKRRTLREAVTFPRGLKKRMLPFFNDYKLNVVDVPRLTPNQISEFRSDFKAIATHFYNLYHEQKIPTPNDDAQHPEATALFFMNVLGGEFTDNLRDFIKRRKGKVPMNSLIQACYGEKFEQAREEGREEGIAIAKEDALREKGQMARQLSQRGFAPEAIAEITNAELAQVQLWLK
ncbi:MAG: hypothetical protein Q4G03_12075 [Planctomycetia bacterium]|nr:hypothetical protein [Planctomycetia bacterium]